MLQHNRQLCSSLPSDRLTVHEQHSFSLMQGLQTLASTCSLPADVKRDVAANGSDPSTAYTVHSYADLQDTQMSACLVPPNCSYAAAISSCTIAKNYTCCVDYGQVSSTRVRHRRMNSYPMVICPILWVRHGALSLCKASHGPVLSSIINCNVYRLGACVV